MKKYFYYNNCVNWPSRDVHAEGGLVEMINNAIFITRETFLKNVGKQELREIERELGYS